MKIKNNFRSLLFFASVLLVASCSKNDDSVQPEEDARAAITFKASLSKGPDKTTGKLSDDVPTCSESSPAYVDIVLTGEENIGTIENPQRLQISDAISTQTEELNLRPGDYQLMYFVVYDSADNPIWIAPSSSPLSEFVENPLPLALTVRANTGNAATVDVLCFDDRELSEFGDVYFDLNPFTAIEFCIAGNTCDGGDANFSINVFSGNDNTAPQLYADLANASGEALCVSLPDLDGEDEYYFEISLDGTLIREGSITDADVKALFDGDTNLNPFIFYEGSSCTSTDSPELFTVVDDGSGGGDPVSFVDYINEFEDFDNTATYDPDYLSVNGFEQYQLSTFTTDFSIAFEAETDSNYPTLADVALTTFDTTGDNGSGVQLTFFGENGDDPSGWRYGDIDAVLVSPGQENADGTFTINVDARRFFAQSNGTVTWYWTNSYAPGTGFTEGNWNVLATDDVQDLNQSGGFLRKEFTGIASTGTLYLAVRVQATIDDGGTPDTAADGNYRYRLRMDNIQIKTEL